MIWEHDGCLHDGEKVIGHINRPGPAYYVARIHRRGRQKYEVVSKHRSRAAAIKAMAAAFATDAKEDYDPINRADVLRVEKGMSYYGPIQICEVRSTS